MAVNYGPSTIRSGLVMHFDMANRQKSWKGAPTTNILESNLSAFNDIYGNSSKTIIGSNEVQWINTGIGPTTVRLYVPQASLTNAQTYGLSVYVKDLVGTVSFDWCDQSITGVNSLTNTPGRLTGTASRSSYDSTYRFLDINLSTGGRATLYNPQVDSVNYVTPYVDPTTSRNTSQAILDLTGNNTITATSLTYNSDGTFSFNGSNNYLETANNIITGNSPFTFECFYTLSGQTGGEIFGNYGSGYSSANYIWISGQYGLYIGGAVYFPGAPIANGTYHMACSRDIVGNCVLYKNGVQVNSGTLTGSIAAGPNFRIGIDTGGTGEPFSGKIYSQRLYNRVLSASEVAQNFNAQRGMYGL